MHGQTIDFVCAAVAVIKAYKAFDQVNA